MKRTVSNKINIIWSTSLIVIGIATIILIGANIIQIELPGIITRVLGAIDLAALPILSFSTVKKFKNKQ